MQAADVIDPALVVFVLLCALAGYMRGMMQPLLGLIAVVLAGLIARFAFKPLSHVFTPVESELLRQILAFLLSFLLAALVLVLLGRRVRRSLHRGGLGGLDRSVGALLKVIQFCFIATFLLTPLQSHPSIGTPFRQSLVLPFVNYVGFVARVVLPFFGPGPASPSSAFEIEIDVETIIAENGGMTRVIQLRGPEAFFPVLGNDAVPMRAAGHWTVENAVARPGSRQLKYTAEFSPGDSPVIWPFRTEWRTAENAFSEQFEYQEIIELDALLHQPEQAFDARPLPAEGVLDSLTREWNHVVGEISRRLAARGLKDARIPVSVTLTAPRELTDVRGRGAVLRKNIASWDFDMTFGQSQELMAWQRRWGWASWLMTAAIILGGGALATIYYRRWLRRSTAHLVFDVTTVDIGGAENDEEDL